MLTGSGMTSLLFITGVKMLLSNLSLWHGSRIRQVEKRWGGWIREKALKKGLAVQRFIEADTLENIDNTKPVII